MSVRVQTQDFDAGLEINALRSSNPNIGAVAAFIGQVRDLNDGDQISGLELEHYPEMTEKSLQAIVDQAKKRWDIIDAVIVHRVGKLKPLDQIVLVLVAASHRKEAFAACEFVMDYLKTEAPFWKKEQTPAGARWVEAKASDDAAKELWNK
ncbi:MAG: molybdenum cofactor biosynthesis protein MoaE [Methylophilaceae bacterium]|nr:molybdenum cofactor biosynthesis protein MoaE [Methylophilaceae bacterium]